MLNSYILFKRNIAAAQDLSILYEALAKQVGLPASFDDLLRSQIVYAVSAFDKFIHDMVRIGMLQILAGARSMTPKYESEPIAMKTIIEMASASVPPKEHFFEQALIRKFKIVSFQDPVKVADGLSYIWNEPKKWQKIGATLGLPEETARTRLKLIIDRRNSIVHEADIDPVSGVKFPISKQESDEALSFLASCADNIFSLIRLP